MYRNGIKRGLDFCISLVALLILWPFILILWLIVRVKMGRPAIFAQARPGYKEKIFTIYKFRTMTDERDEGGDLLPDEKRLTAFGTFLRNSSLDELPQLLNIIRGDLAIVGPRPLLTQYLPLYDAVQRKRHDVRPGFTGHAQVNGRNAITWAQKFALDVWYSEHVSFALDMSIIFKTIKTVLGRQGVSAEGSATMEVFRGNN